MLKRWLNVSEKTSEVFVSIDIGIRNFGLYIVDSETHNPLVMDNLNLLPYSVGTLTSVLDNVLEKMDVKKVLVEQQMPTNAKAKEVFYHLQMYIHMKYPKCEFVVCSARSKGIGKCKTYKDRKCASVELASAYFKSKDHTSYFLKLKESYKADDMADAVCQLLNHLKIW
jgi:Holliday junction resolvasome RuvABC endonuclease subunit